MAEQVDAAGNVGKSAPSTFTVDRTRPALSSTTPGAVNDTTPELRGTAGIAAGDGATVTVSLYGQRLEDYQTWTADRDPVTGAFGVTSRALAPGRYGLEFIQTDAAGNRSTVVHEFVIDTVAPPVALTAPGPRTRRTTFPFTGTAASEPRALGVAPAAAEVTITVSRGAEAVWTRVVAIEADGSFTSPTATLAEGDYTVRVTRTDLAGNVGSVTRALAVDTTAPSPAVTSPAANATVGNRPTFTGTAGAAAGDAGTVTVRVYEGDAAGGAAAQTFEARRDDSGAFRVDSPFALADGVYTVQVAQSDDLGNAATSAPVTFTVAPTPPSADTPPVDAVRESVAKDTRAPRISKARLSAARVKAGKSTTLSFRLDEAAVVTVKVKGRSKRITKRAAKGVTKLRIATRKLKRGRHVLTLVAKDKAGNTARPVRVVLRVG